MPLEFIPTRSDQSDRPDLEEVIVQIQANAANLGLDDGIMYYGWPKYQDYESKSHPVDIAILSKRHGLVLTRGLVNANANRALDADDSLVQAAATAEAQMIKSAELRGARRQLKIPVTPVLLTTFNAPNLDLQSEKAQNATALVQLLNEMDDANLTDHQIEEARSILEGAKALTRSQRRLVEKPNEQPTAFAIATLEDQIARFDARQRSVALTNLNCPQRIRGLAGSGKTIILAMKAALAHIEDPSARILVTYYTRSLQTHLRRMISRFFRHFAEGDPDWKQIHVQHGWGQKNLPGVYREAAVRAGISPMTYGEAQRYGNPFDHVCKSLTESGKVKPYYDVILIDEGQDFPEGFYRLCYDLCHGDRDKKRIIWAYDELQDIFDVRVRTPEELFGVDDEGEPRISLQRSLPPQAETNDFVLPKCYRNQRDILVLSHAIGFGLYGTPVQMLQNKEHWEDVGYEVVQGNFEKGSQTIIHRPARNSPAILNCPPGFPLVKVSKFGGAHEEVNDCVKEVVQAIKGGLEPHDVMVIAIDDRAAQMYLREIAKGLARVDIDTNNIIADKYSEPPFTIEGKVTLTTVYRAKGNETAFVYVVGCDAIPLKLRTGRNRLFTAFTRTKGWLRISGLGEPFGRLKDEIDRALGNAPDLKFSMPDLAEIDLIQRDLAEKDARLMRAREQMDELKNELGLTDEDLKSLIERKRR